MMLKVREWVEFNVWSAVTSKSGMKSHSTEAWQKSLSAFLIAYLGYLAFLCDFKMIRYLCRCDKGCTVLYAGPSSGANLG